MEDYTEYIARLTVAERLALLQEIKAHLPEGMGEPSFDEALRTAEEGQLFLAAGQFSDAALSFAKAARRTSILVGNKNSHQG